MSLSADAQPLSYQAEAHSASAGSHSPELSSDHSSDVNAHHTSLIKQSRDNTNSLPTVQPSAAGHSSKQTGGRKWIHISERIFLNRTRLYSLFFDVQITNVVILHCHAIHQLGIKDHDISTFGVNRTRKPYS